ncbi:hypothetical protein A3K29_01410 [Candidatus Collierbacteria bacterium RIFOXYB2_FULL_46_14]|uniref:Fimbrial assembly family protein n=1 Tax=Candidatus Collierbacteria bacterium GW2011_GWA2_46_26 TaxID=1618381 RepID=A0A0G1RS80_9BACT|nr:MAG: hypothetical protein UW29_C0006G0021 [Candidatus Collierbacteria bacterium GW2011_GWC2_44_13]KKU32808.1 MAG: hypothetical protein UX47_C0007G0052 [Candidatus Collierbacteria bacterium GW2011_GWA2_46_26]OGD72787.1 MAG: hypothetical protein A3K29_01410 [Candidatus Collierbacteria bacterium RIFOXYB2_FULL_46_14]OGD75829.1 MAG: hypothetical protein A3K43_01410 [Candidatus Collierbacteria bacterium RIFOXYA2_FULL_46_20]OGD77165.1 MAG: hypothetical protein A3K39_01410 [Candidatus Collierbacteri
MAAQQGVFHINLLPKDSFNYSTLGKFLTWATTSGRVLVVLTEFVVLLAFGSRFYFDKKVNDLKEEVDQKQAQIQAFSDTERIMRTILAKQAPVNGYLTKNLEFNERYDELSRVMPAGVRLDKLIIDKNGMALVGESDSELGFAQLLQGLKKFRGVARLSMKETSFDQTTGTVKFNIQTTFQ